MHPDEIKNKEPNANITFFDQYALQRVKRALSCPTYKTPLELDDFFALNDFIQACIIHDYVIYADVFYRYKREDDLGISRDLYVSNNIEGDINKLDFLGDDPSLDYGADTIIPLTDKELQGINKYEEKMLRFYWQVFEMYSEVNGSIYAEKENKKVLDFISNWHGKTTSAISKRLYEKFRTSVSDKVKKISEEYGIKRYSIGIPLLSDYIISQCQDGNTRCILNIVKELHYLVAEPFRSYAKKIGMKLEDVSVKNALNLQNEIDEFFNSIIYGRKAFPSKLMLSISPVIAFWKFDLAGLIGSARDIKDFLSSLNNEFKAKNFKILENSYKGTLSSHEFYQELKRVFCKLKFSEQEFKNKLVLI